MTGVTLMTAFASKYSTGKVTLMSAATMPLFSVRISGVTLSFTSSRSLAIFLKQLQLENARAAATSTMLNFMKFFIGLFLSVYLLFAFVS